ncbi:unnamed protein product [Arabis nemorensis]|uniref:Uncharacterized protein n=1 Tax=Arabis nemorensis TaxID=586526 RepID=A0A565AXF3_9BRAS|nr:unnamed protein product [Arabis nemorensis]
MKFLRCEALEDALESTLNDFDSDRVSMATSVGSSMEEDLALEYELAALREAMDSGLTYLLAH